MIVVDDGSTDGTRRLLEPYGDRIRYHYQTNQGLAVARNTGLGLASGEYLTYLDGDDAWEPHNLEVKAAVLARFPDVGGVFSEFSIFGSGKDQPRGTRQTFPFFERTGFGYSDLFAEKHPVEVAGASADLYVGNVFEKLFLGNFILPTTMVFHRERALATGQFRAHMRTQQDYEYWLRFSRQHRFAFIDAPLARYRRHPQQLTNFRNIERILVRGGGDHRPVPGRARGARAASACSRAARPSCTGISRRPTCARVSRRWDDSGPAPAWRSIPRGSSCTRCTR